MQELGLAPFPFSFIVSLMWVAIFMLLGITLRALIPFCRKYLIPACMVGGLAAFLIMNFLPLEWLGFMQPNTKDMEVLVYHLFNISFVCFGLSGLGTGGGKGSTKSILKNSVWMAIANTANSRLQTALVVIALALYNIVMGTDLLESAGFLTIQGFVAGPGAALAAGAVFEQAGHTGMMSLGLAFAAMGYVFSILVGVPCANYIMRRTGVIRKGEIIPKDEQYGIYENGKEPEAGKLRFMSSNVDSMTYQMCLILLAYGFAYFLCMCIRATGIIGPQGMGILWSLFNALICLPAGLIIRLVLNRTSAGHLFDIGCHQRLLNIVIDLMALAALAGISIHVLREWWGAMLVVSVLLSVTTVLLFWFMCRKHKEYAGERFLVLVGTATGTITTGLVLVRMLDPKLSNPVPIEVGLMAIPSLLISMPLMPFIMPYTYAQVYGTGSYWAIIIVNLILGPIFLILTMLPIWGIFDKKAKF